MIDPRSVQRLPADTRALLLSDLHLGDGSAGDLFGWKDNSLLRVIEEQSATADVVVINGDAFDHLQAGGAAVVEQAHPAVCAALRALCKKVPVYYVMGNHERPELVRGHLPDCRFVDALEAEGGICITHGHQFDLHWQHAGLGGTDRLLRLHGMLERWFRVPIRLPLRDYDNLPNRVVHRLFFLGTEVLRLRGLLYAILGRPGPYERWARLNLYWGLSQWGDLNAIFHEASRYLSGPCPYRCLVLGHSHQPGVVLVGERRYVNIGSWAHEQATYALLTEGEVCVFSADGRRLGDEGYRVILAGRGMADMASWFQRYYRPFFRYDLRAIHRDFPKE